MATMGIEEILKNLPHRYPFLLVDRIVECDDQKKIVGVKNVTMNEPFFQGHFPGRPVMPGVLQIEAMAQTGGILLNRLGGGTTRIPFFMTIDNAKFRRPVVPGDVLRMEVEIVTLRAKLAKFHGVASVDGTVASEADLMCMITDEEAAR